MNHFNRIIFTCAKFPLTCLSSRMIHFSVLLLRVSTLDTCLHKLYSVICRYLDSTTCSHTQQTVNHSTLLTLIDLSSIINQHICNLSVRPITRDNRHILSLNPFILGLVFIEAPQPEPQTRFFCKLSRTSCRTQCRQTGGTDKTRRFQFSM